MTEKILQINRMDEAMNVFGSFDANIKIVEQAYGVTVANRGGELKVTGGEEEKVEQAAGCH